MGHIKHHAIVVVSDDDESLKKAHASAKEIFARHLQIIDAFSDSVSIPVGDIIPTICNGGGSFLVAPDGSKEGWDISDACDAARKEFIGWMQSADSECEFVEITLGADDNIEQITASSIR